MLRSIELGQVADTVSMYGAVERIRMTPLGKQSDVAVAAPALLPMIPVVAIMANALAHSSVNAASR